jgi:hypothetical protein
MNFISVGSMASLTTGLALGIKAPERGQSSEHFAENRVGRIHHCRQSLSEWSSIHSISQIGGKSP